MRDKETTILVAAFAASFLTIPMNLVWDALGIVSPMPYNLVAGSLYVIFTLLHGKKYIGLKSILILFVVTFVISLIMEHYGVVTGRIFGEYHYGDLHGEKIFGTVPVLIPLSWFLFLYPAVIITNEILGIENSDINSIKPGPSMLIIAVFMDAIITTGLDILIDPLWVSRGSWFWTGLGSLPPERIFYNIPVQNYFGWILTTLLIFAAFRFYHHTAVPHAGSEPAFRKSILYYLPVFNYMAIFVVGCIESYWLLNNTGLIFTAIMTMGMVSLIMANRIVIRLS